MPKEWKKFWHPNFKNHYLDVLKIAENLAKKDPNNFYNHPHYKFFESVTDCIENRIFINPEKSDFRLGKTLGKDYKAWRRAKKGLPQRYRLFFKFSSQGSVIVLAWLNDEKSIRKSGSKNDVYEVFKKLLTSGRIPNSFNDLLKSSKEYKLKLAKK